MTCTVSSISASPSKISWVVAGTEYDSTSTDQTYRVIDGSFGSPDAGSIESKLEITAPNSDIPVTCKVEVPDGTFETAGEQKVFGVHSHDDVTLTGSSAILTCVVDGFSATVTQSTDVEWTRKSDGTKMDVSLVSWSETDDGNGHKVGTTTLSISAVPNDETYSCKIRIDGNWVTKEVTIDAFDITVINDIVVAGIETLARLVVSGLLSDPSHVAISWVTSSDSPVPNSQLTTYSSFANDGLTVTVSADSRYTGKVSVVVDAGSPATVREFDNNMVNVDFVDITHDNVIVSDGAAADLICRINNVETASNTVTWSLHGSAGWTHTETTFTPGTSTSQTTTNTKPTVDHSTDQGEWDCSISYNLATDHSGTMVTRTLSETLFLDIPSFQTPLPANEYVLQDTSVTFTCLARTTTAQNLVPAYSWNVGGTVQTGETQSSLTLTAIQDLDDRSVQCIATYPPNSYSITTTSQLFVQGLMILPDSSLYAVAGVPLTITCSYDSAHASNIAADWAKDENPVTNDGVSYSIVEDTSTPGIFISKLTILTPSTSDHNAEYKCSFTSTESGTNELTATIDGVYDITTPPVKQNLVSGYSATFDIAVSSKPDTFATTYIWMKDDDTTAVNTDTAVSSFTTPQLFYSSDSNNKYSCKVTWTRNDNKQVLTKTSDKVAVVITRSCEVVGTLNSDTHRSPGDAYVVDGTSIATTCEKGAILPVGSLYSQTCDVESPVNLVNCVDGCFIPDIENSSLYNGVIQISDTQPLSGAGYTTIHTTTTATIVCNSGYVVSTSETLKSVDCSTRGELDMNFCVKGCEIVDTNNAVYNDPDNNNLIAPDDKITYTCKDNLLTESGTDHSESGTCQNGQDLPLNNCFEIIMQADPDEEAGSSFIKITVYPPIIKEQIKAVQNYVGVTCEVTQDGQSSHIDSGIQPSSDCVVNGLFSNTSYTYKVTAHFSSSAAKWISEPFSFTTTATQSGISKDGTLSIEVPAASFDIRTYSVIAVWFRDTSKVTSNIVFNGYRRKRSTEAQIYRIHKSFADLEDSGQSPGAYYVLQDIRYDPNKGVHLEPGVLNLPAGKTFALVAHVCDPSDSSYCVTGSGTQYSTPANNTAYVIAGVVAAVLVLVTVSVGLFVYMRRSRRPSTKDNHEMFNNPLAGTSHLEDGKEITEIERRVPDPIHVADFLSTYRRLMQDTEYLLDREYDEIKCEVPPSNFTYYYSKLPENKIKNRYVDIVPYDETRVVLQCDANNPSDYINACFVTNMADEVEFIAAQGPKEETICDFWQMIWENRSLSIVMLTNLVEKGRKKCAQYWTDEGTMDYGEISVTVEAFLLFPDYCVRTMTLTKGKESRSVFHFHYLIWPDHGAPPTTSLIDFCRRCFSETVDGPVVVHCSAGVGRTGTIIALHLQMRMLAEDQRVDLFGIVCRMRRCRKLMVQTSVQYKFLYQAVREMIICDDTFIAARDFNSVLAKLTTPRQGAYMTLLDDQFRRLEDYCTIHITHDKPEFKTSAGSAGINHNKNRYSNVLPYDHNRVKLMVTTGETGSDYINASYINSYHERDAFIATQGPKPNTIGDFWRMIFEKDVSTIVMLTPLVDRGREKCSMYWPRDKEEPICVENITVHLLSVANPTDDYTVRTFSVSIRNREDDTTRQVKQYHYFKWTDTETPPSGKYLIKMMDQVKNQRRTGPMVVHCSAGIGRTAVFVAVFNCVEQLRQDEMIDLFTIVLRLRLQRNGMIRSVDQYAFCYRVMAEVCAMYEDYVNTQGLR